MKFSPEHINLWEDIHKILREDWDPIGINNEDGGPADEYNGYVPKIMQLKIQGATEEAILQQLLLDEEYIMGEPGNYNHCQTIAKKITDLKFLQ